MSKMQLLWSPINAAWISVFGDSLCAIRGENFFSSIQQARDAITQAGLRLHRVSPGQYLIVGAEEKGGQNGNAH